MKTEQEQIEARLKPIWVVQVQADGGCKGNPGRKYGSYKARLNGQLLCCASRFELGFGTNQEAELEAIEVALKASLERIRVKQIDPMMVRAVILTDSVMARNRLMLGNKIRNYKSDHKCSRAEAMRVRAERCLELLKPYHSFYANWHSRINNVAVFGH